MSAEGERDESEKPRRYGRARTLRESMEMDEAFRREDLARAMRDAEMAVARQWGKARI